MTQHATDNARYWYHKIAGLITQLDSDDENTRELAKQDISYGLLSIKVRSAWHRPGVKPGAPAEYAILLTLFGGPALRIIGSLNEHQRPVSAALEWKDGTTPWTRVVYEDVLVPEGEYGYNLLRYAECFRFEG